MNTNHYEVLSQDQDLLSFTCLREAANYSAGLPEERRRLESWDGGYEPKPKLSADFDFFNLRLPFGEDAAPARAVVGAQLVAAAEQLEQLETAAEGLAEEGAPSFPMRIRLRRTCNEVVVDDGAAPRERAGGDPRLDGKANRQLLSEPERLHAKLLKTRQFWQKSSALIPSVFRLERLHAKLLKTRQFWQKSSALIPSVFRLARLFDDSGKSLFEFQDLSGKHLLVQNYHKSREANAGSGESCEGGEFGEQSEDCRSDQFLTPF